MNVNHWVKDVVRDPNLHSKRNVLDRAGAMNGGGGPKKDFYLGTASKSIEVDHVFECQLLSHCIAASEDVTTFLKRQATMTSSKLSEQPIVIQNFLQPVYDAQNGQKNHHIVEEPFNLRLMDKSLNIYKGKAYTSFLKDTRAGRIRPTMQESLLSCKSYADREDREAICGKILSELGSVHSEYESYIDAIEDSYGAQADTVSKHRAKYVSIKSEINELYDQMGV
jgi:hypothetical protein